MQQPKTLMERMGQPLHLKRSWGNDILINSERRVCTLYSSGNAIVSFWRHFCCAHTMTVHFFGIDAIGGLCTGWGGMHSAFNGMADLGICSS